MSSYNLSAAETALNHPNVKAFLGAIQQAEGGQYNNVYGGKSFSDYSIYPKTNAAGAYQIAPGTFKSLSNQLGLNDFSPHTQDLMAVQQLNSIGAVTSLQNNDVTTAIEEASHTWAALPVGPGSQDHSFYSFTSGAKFGQLQPSMPYADFIGTYHNLGGQ